MPKKYASCLPIVTRHSSLYTHRALAIEGCCITKQVKKCEHRILFICGRMAMKHVIDFPLKWSCNLLCPYSQLRPKMFQWTAKSYDYLQGAEVTTVGGLKVFQVLNALSLNFWPISIWQIGFWLIVLAPQWESEREMLCHFANLPLCPTPRRLNCTCLKLVILLWPPVMSLTLRTLLK